MTKLESWSKNVRSRDGACMTCGATENLVAHHVKPKALYPELMFDVANGITLCACCHSKHHTENPVSIPAEGGRPSFVNASRVQDLGRIADELLCKIAGAANAEQSFHAMRLQSIVGDLVSIAARAEKAEQRGRNISAANIKLRRALDNATAAAAA